MDEFLAQLFSYVCSQTPDHMWAPGGVTLPCCQRCLGFYAGAFVALAAMLKLRLIPDTRLLQIHGVLLLQMIPFGFHLVPQNGVVRTVSGFLFGLGVTVFLWTMPSQRLPGAAESRRGDWAYAAYAAIALVSVVVAARAPLPSAAHVLSVVALGGLVSIAALLVVDAGLVAAILVSRRQGHA